MNARTAQLVKLLNEVGPDVPEISRRLNQFKESVRYRYKEKILSKGFEVQANVDHEKLGLRRVVVVLDFADEYKKFSQSILLSMNELCFLVSFARTMPGGCYITNFSVPREFLGQFKIFLQTLKEKGILSRLEAADFEWFRFAPMKSEFYDFDTGRWDFDWSARSKSDFGSAQYAPSTQTRFDYTDLVIIKELQLDANKSLKEISDKLNVNYKKLAWHYTTHVMGRRLISGYRVNWTRTRVNYAIEKALHRQHRYLAIGILVHGVTDYEMISLRLAVNRLPFLWCEAAGTNYYCEFSFPVDFVVEGLQFLTDTISKVKERTEIFTIDQSDAGTFTIFHSMFNQTRKRWEFNLAEITARFEALLVEIRKEPP